LEAGRGDRLFVVGLFGLLVLVCAGLLLGSAALIGAVMKLLAGH
jgi:hypothetical protein